MEHPNQCAVFHVTERGQDAYFKLGNGLELLDTAHALWRYLHRNPEMDAGSFAEQFPDRTPVTAAEFDRLARLRMENTGEVTGVFELDFDKREFSAVHIMDGWKTFAIGDVSDAADHAFRENGITPDQRWECLLDGLEGRALPSAGHLSAQNFSFAEEITEMDHLLSFYLEAGFNVDMTFGTHVCTAENDDWLNVYANYDMARGQVCDELELVLVRGDGGEESRSYSLNAAEKEVLLQKMDAYCQQQTEQTLAGYSAQRMAESLTPPAGPVM